MTVAVCIDNNGGMLFNNRRQSRDSAVIADLIKSGGGRIFCDTYSLPLFSGYAPRVTACENFLSAAEENDICFVENRPQSEWESAQKIIVYHWNRLYPSDLRLFPLPENNARLRLSEREEFKGTSHEKITKEVYEKCG